MNSYRRHPESLDPPKAKRSEPCPLCGDPLCRGVETENPQLFIACRLGQIAREFKRLNDFMEAGEKEEDEP